MCGDQFGEFVCVYWGSKGYTVHIIQYCEIPRTLGELRQGSFI